MNNNVTKELFKQLDKKLDTKTVEVVNYVDTVSSLIDRTYIAMGKRVKYNSYINSTVNSEINAGNTASTTTV
jgi:hypothetical protein